MIRKILGATLLTTLALSCIAEASETRAPFITQHGPLRYDLYKKKNKCSFNMWSTGHYRSANKAYLKHGTDSSPLTALIFGKSEFYMNESFEDATDILYLTENRSPYLAVTKIAPRVSYTEYGATLGGRFEYPVWKNKGRVGLRAAIPFRTVRMERDDQAEAAATGIQDSVIRGDATLITAYDALGGPPNEDKRVFQGINRYKLALLHQMLRMNDAGQVTPLLDLRDGGAAPSGINGNQYTKTVAQIDALGVDVYSGTQIPWVIIPSNADKTPPFGAPTAVTIDPSNPAQSKFFNKPGVVAFGKNVTAWNANGGAIKPLEENGSNAVNSDTNDTGYVFALDRDYTELPEAPNFKDLWATPVFIGTEQKPADPDAIAFIEAQLESYRTNIEEFMNANAGFIMATNQRTGLGDIDLDAFYEHTFNNNWRGELFAGVRFPTGGSDKMLNNPFTQQLGNSNHFEIKLGANIGWAALDWMNLKAEAWYSFVLEDTEHRLAVFKGSTIKNFGPSVDADVDWGYFVGKIDATFYHPKTEDLSTTIGYQLYYKTEENIHFKKASTIDHALGKVWADGDNVKATVANGIKGTQWIGYEMPLDNKLAEANTEAIAHRVYLEGNWKAHKYMSLYAGGAFTFAGKNMPREGDIHCGALVKF